MATSIDPFDDVRELAELLRPAWATISDGIRASGVPTCEGDDDDGAGDTDDAGNDDGDAADAGDGDKTDHSDRPNWEQQSRKHERRAKAAEKRTAELEARLKEREDATKTETEKLIEKARQEARTEALTESEQARRNDRLEVQVTRLASKTFADTEDALIHIQRAITAGDIDPDDIFDNEGKVQTDSLKTALEDLLERKPHLAAGTNGNGRDHGDADAGKGSGGAKDLESMSVEDHLARKR